MTIRSFAMLFHLLGMIGLFAGFAIESLAATPATAPAVRRFYGIGAATILLSGIFLSLREHVFDSGWVRVSFGMILLMGLLGSLRRSGSLQLRVSIGLAALFMMIAKPDFPGSLYVAAVGIGAGVAATYFSQLSKPRG